MQTQVDRVLGRVDDFFDGHYVSLNALFSVVLISL